MPNVISSLPLVGDDTNTALPIIIAVAALIVIAAAIALIVISRKKRNDR